jgi:uncharacterized coiled-coil DUF342 family protein
MCESPSNISLNLSNSLELVEVLQELIEKQNIQVDNQEQIALEVKALCKKVKDMEEKLVEINEEVFFLKEQLCL